MKVEKQPRSFWPIAIIGYFIVALIGIVIFISWAVHQNIDLVRKDYYAEEVQFQQQLNRVARTKQLNADAYIFYDQQKQSVTLKVPTDGNEKTLGRIHFYRPSDAALDKNVRLTLNREGLQNLDVRELKSGLWKVQLQWNSNGEDFYSEKSIIISRSNS